MRLSTKLLVMRVGRRRRPAEVLVSAFVVRTSSSSPLFDIVPIGENWRAKPVLDGSGRKKSRSATRRS